MEVFISLCKRLTTDSNLIDELWREVEKCYAEKKRYYHTFHHLENLLQQLDEVKDLIKNWDAVLFSLYYHDIVYNASKSDNEERSAQMLEQRMKQLSASADLIERCKQQILSTKSHILSQDEDTNYFTDADLSVLGQEWEAYSVYFKNVRKEYSIYPDFLYNPGRKKVLKHFLAMPRIFKTAHFYNKFESQAKDNLQKELNLIN